MRQGVNPTFHITSRGVRTYNRKQLSLKNHKRIIWRVFRYMSHEPGPEGFNIGF